MKNLKFLAGIISIVIAFTFSSCTNEPIDPAINLDNFNQTCAVPTSFQVGSFINNNSVSLSWVAGAGETGWTIEYGLVGFALGTGATVTSQTTTITVAGLNSSNSYSFYLKSNCSSTSSSSWVGPVTIQAIVVNPNCVNPSNLTAVRNATLNTNVDLTWTAGGTETQWEIQYGLTGFAIGSGTIVSSTTSTKQISNILATSDYDFYVRAKCSATENSGWIGPKNVSAVGQNGSNVFYAKVNGTEFVDVSVLTGSLTFNNSPSIIISATNAAENSIEITVKNDAIVGVPYFNTTNIFDDKFEFRYWEPVPYSLTTLLNGSITITEKTTTRIKGTFYFDAVDGTFAIRHITEGTFDVALP